jgi:hypothetical protein
MRKLVIAIAAVGAVAAFLPVQSASASCITAYYQLTGQCSPCNTVGNASRNLHDKYGTPNVTMNCVA